MVNFPINMTHYFSALDSTSFELTINDEIIIIQLDLEIECVEEEQIFEKEISSIDVTYINEQGITHETSEPTFLTSLFNKSINEYESAQIYFTIKREAEAQLERYQP